jgi:hypothetical protein
MRNAHNILVGKSEGKRLLEDLGVDERIIFAWILRKQGEKVYSEFIWLRIGVSGGLL